MPLPSPEVPSGFSQWAVTEKRPPLRQSVVVSTTQGTPPPFEAVTDFATVLLPAAFVAVSDTLYVAAERNACVGFCAVDVFDVPDAGSPKFQSQEVGEPPDVSVNATCVPIVGAVGWKEKFAVGAAWPDWTTIVPCIIAPCTSQ